jgi:hypothetical protein
MQEQQVKNYKNQRAFQKDAAKLQKDGWFVQGQNSYQPRGLIFAKRQQIIVTYTRATQNIPPPLATGKPGYAADGRRLTLKESIQQAKEQRGR